MAIQVGKTGDEAKRPKKPHSEDGKLACRAKPTTTRYCPAAHALRRAASTFVLLRRKMVGVDGFEPPTSCSQSRRSSQAELHPDVREGVITKFSSTLSIGYLPPFPGGKSAPATSFCSATIRIREGHRCWSCFSRPDRLGAFPPLEPGPIYPRCPGGLQNRKRARNSHRRRRRARWRHR